MTCFAARDERMTSAGQATPTPRCHSLFSPDPGCGDETDDCCDLCCERRCRSARSVSSSLYLPLGFLPLHRHRRRTRPRMIHCPRRTLPRDRIHFSASLVASSSFARVFLSCAVDGRFGTGRRHRGRHRTASDASNRHEISESSNSRTCR